MKSPISNPAFLLLALVGMAAAASPKKAPITKYSGLWTNSPFTSKPPRAEPGEVNNPLDDYSLIGVSSLGTKNYRVTMINKKKPDEPRIYVETNSESKGFKILGVTRKDGDPLATVVRMQSGSMTGDVSYDQKLLTLAAPQAARVNPQVPGGQPAQPGQVVPGQQPQLPGGIPQPVRQPRPRVVPPPAPTIGGQIQPGQIQPNQLQVQPVQVQPGQVIQGQPSQGQQSNRADRPQRRGNN